MNQEVNIKQAKLYFTQLYKLCTSHNLQCFKCVTTFKMDRTTLFVMASRLLIEILVPGAVASMET